MLNLLLAFGMILLFLQTLFYFGSDFMLRNYLKEKIKQSSGNKYEVDFETFRILFIQRGITFIGLKVSPIQEQFDTLDEIPSYSAEVDEVTVKGLNYLFRKKEIVVGDIQLLGPQLEFRFVEKEAKPNTPSQSPLLTLQQEIKKSFLGSQINEIRIKRVTIQDADLLLKDFISQKTVQAENTYFHVRDIQLMQDRKPATPFNALGFEFGFDNFSLLLADSVHTATASHIQVSSLQNYIEAKGVHIHPDLSRYSPNYFSVDLDDIKLVDADINKVFYTAEVEVGELSLRRPRFDFVSREGKDKEFESEKVDFDLYDLIDGFLKSVEIRDFEINDGSFRKKSYGQAPGEYRIKGERIDFQMADFYVGPDEAKRKDRFFYAKDAAVSLREFELALSDSIHWIKGEYVKMSSFDDNIRVEGLQLFPVQFSEMQHARNILDIEVSELHINNANLKKTYNESILDLDEVVLIEPKIVLKDLESKESTKPDASLKAVFEEYLHGIYFKRFEIRDGSLVMDNRVKIRQDSLSFGKMNLVLENFALDEETEKADSRSLFVAENLHLEFEDYALKLSDNLHFFKADRLALDTKREEIIIDGFSIRPNQREQIFRTLERYGKNSALDIFIPRFEAKGVNIIDAYFDGVLRVKQINLPKPQISISSVKRESSLAHEEEGMTRQEIVDILTDYFDVVQVDSLSLSGGTISLESHGQKGKQSFSDKDVSLGIKNFHVERGRIGSNSRVLFSEEVRLQLNRYVFNVADGKYVLDAERINFSSAKEQIEARNVKLSPRRDLNEKLKISAVIPTMLFKGVDLEAFLFENRLGLEKLELDNANVGILINDDIVEPQDQRRRRQERQRSLPRTIEVVKIDTILAQKAKLTVSIREDGIQKELVNTGINLSFFDFHLDSVKLKRKDFVGLFSGMSLGADEFWLTLADSVHRVTFRSVQFDTKRDAVFFQNIRVIPNSLSGKTGIPVFSGHVPALLIKTKSLEELQKGKEIALEEVTLFRPDMEVFVDDQKAERNPKAKGEAGTGLFETLKLDDFKIVEGKFSVFDKNTGSEPVFLNSLNVSLSDIAVDLASGEPFDPKTLLEEDFEVAWTDYELLLKDSLNRLRVGGFRVSNKEIVISDLSLTPRVGKFEYSRQVGYQTDVAHIHIPEIRIFEPDFGLMLSDKTVVAKSLKIVDVEASVYRDKRFPARQNVFRPMPQKLLKDAGFVLRLDTLQVQNGRVHYEEFPEKGMLPGRLEFSELSTAIFPFFMGKEEGQDFPIAESFLIANATLNGEAVLNMQGHLFYHEPFPMRINAQLGDFHIGILNSIIKPNAHARVRDGKILKADWSFEADDDEAFGRMAFLYEDLNLELVEERTLERGRGKKSILTFVLNTFAVRSNNPRGYQRKPINASIYQERNKEKFIFNYWWKTTLSGIKGSLGLGQARKPKRRKPSNESKPASSK